MPMLRNSLIFLFGLCKESKPELEMSIQSAQPLRKNRMFINGPFSQPHMNMGQSCEGMNVLSVVHQANIITKIIARMVLLSFPVICKTGWQTEHDCIVRSTMGWQRGHP